MAVFSEIRVVVVVVGDRTVFGGDSEAVGKR